MLRVVQDEAERAEFAEVLDEIVRNGARRMLAAALESEVDAYVAAPFLIGSPFIRSRGDGFSFSRRTTMLVQPP